jgi:hypothetical protein
MPGGDGTGPLGRRAMRGAGQCAGMGRIGNGPGWRKDDSALAGQGFGGWGWRNMQTGGQSPQGRAWTPPAVQPRADSQQERNILKNQMETLSAELAAIKARLAEIES